MQAIIQDKKRFRQKMLHQRAQLDKESKQTYDTWVCQELERLINSKGCTTVHAYLPMGTEIDIYPLLRQLLGQGITVITPKVLPKRQLENRVLTALTELEDGLFGTKHPANTEVHTGKIDFIIVPGLAYDKHFFRLGYGGGYYDTFMSEHPEALKVGICYPFQYVDEVPKEEHDLQLDEVLMR